MPVIAAHRGGAGLRPENTLAACAHASALGAEALEIDVRLSRDGQVVVFHDAAPDPAHVRADGGGRLGGTPPLVRDLSFRELKMFDVGYPRASRAADGAIVSVPGERIPSLGELLDFTDRLPAAPQLFIELKSDFHTGSPLDPVELTDAVLGVLGARTRTGQIRLLSFDWRCLVHAMEATGPEGCVFLSAPADAESTAIVNHAECFAGHSPARHRGSAVEAVRALGGRHWGPHHGRLDPEGVAEAREAGIRVTAWTANEPRHLMRMYALGVNALITDYPDRALALRNSAETCGGH